MADRYWVGGTGTWNTTSTTNWSASSGGASGASVPTAADNVIFDQAGTYTVTCTGTLTCLDITVSAGTVTISGTGNLNISGSMSLVSATVWGITTTNFTATTTGKTVTTNGVFLINIVNFTGTGGGWTLGSALSVGNALSITAGTFNTANYNISAFRLGTDGTVARTINLGSSTVSLSSGNSAGSGPISFVTNTNLTFNPGTSQINITASTGNPGFAGGGFTFYNVAFTGTGGIVLISDANTFNNLSITGPSFGVRYVTFSVPITVNGVLSTTGTAGNRRVMLSTANYGMTLPITVNSTPSLIDVDLRDVSVIGTAAPISGTRLGDLGGCSGITFSTPKTVYWNQAIGGNWSGTNWALSAGGAVSDDYFPLEQDTATFVNTGLNTSASVTIDVAYPIGTVDMSGRTNAMTLATSTTAVGVYGDWKNGTGTALSGTGVITFGGRNTQTITSAGKAFTQPITIDSYGGIVQLADALVTTVSTITVTNGTFDTQGYAVTASTLSSSNSNVRTINLGASTLTLGGLPAILMTTTTNLTFNAGTSSVVQTGSPTSQSFSAPGLTWYNMSFTSTSPNTGWTISGPNTFNNLSFAAPASESISSLTFGNNCVINGTLTCAGASAVRRIILQSSVSGTQRDLTVGTLVADDCDFRDIEILGTAAGTAPTRAGNCGNNAGITFPSPKTVYWNLAGAQNWSATGWATSSGGTPAVNNFPLAQDTAVFDNTGSAGTITINATWHIGTFNASARSSAMALDNSGYSPSIYGDFINGTGLTWVGAAGIDFRGGGSNVITSNGTAINTSIRIVKVTGTITLTDALSGSANSLSLTSGTFDAATYNVTRVSFDSSGTLTRVLKMGSGTWTLSSSTGAWSVISNNMTLLSGTSTIVLSDATAGSRTFIGGSFYYNKLVIGGATGSSTLTFSGNNTFGELASTKTVAHTIAFGSTIQTFGKWTVTGTAGNVVTLTGTSTTNAIIGSRVTGVDYLAMGTIGFSTSTSLGEFYAGANSTGTGAGVIRTAAPAPVTRYWVGGTGTWDTTTTTNWSATSGGAGGASVPTSADAVVFDSASSAASYTVTCTSGILIRCGSLTMAGPATGTVTWAGSAPLVIHGNFSLAATGITRSFTGTLTFSGSSTTTTINTNGVSLASSITINGIGCKWTLASALVFVGVSGFTVTSGEIDTAGFVLTTGTLSSNSVPPRTITLGSSTVTLSSTGTAVNLPTTINCTLNAGTSQILLTGTTAVLGAGGQTFYNVAITSNGLTTGSIIGTNTFNNLTIGGRTVAGISVVTIANNQIINGTLTLSAGTNATMRTFVQSDTLGTTRTLTCAAVATPTDIDFRDIVIAGAAAPISGTRLGDCQGNSGITFDAAKTVYWQNTPAGGNWSAAAWATSIGGASSIANFPLAQDIAVIPASSPNSGSIITVNANWNIGTINMSARTSNTMTLDNSTNSPTIYGNWINGTGTTLSGGSVMSFAGRGTQNITSAGKPFTHQVRFSGPGGSVVLQDAMTVNPNTIGALGLTAGTFNLNGYSCTISGSTSNFSTSGNTTLAFGVNGVISAWGTSGVTVTSPTTITGTGTITLTSAATKTFAGGGTNFSGITLDQGGAGALTITGNNTFKDITNTYSATGATTISLGATTQTVAQFTGTGTSGKVLTIQGTSLASPAGLVLTSGKAGSPNYLTIFAVRAYSPSDTWYAGANSVNNGSLGWIFAAYPGTVYVGLVSEAATSTDTVQTNGNVVYDGVIAETASVTDAVSLALIMSALLADTATATESVTTQAVLTSNIFETATGTDVNSVIANYVANFADSATVTDIGSGGLAFFTAVSEAATATDMQSIGLLFQMSVAEAATVTDALSTRGTFGVSISDTATSTDAVSPRGVFNTSISDATTALDSLIASGTYRVAVQESATASDLVQILVVFNVSTADSVSLTEAIAAARNVVASIAETSSATDPVTATVTFQAAFSDAALLSATVPVRLQFNTQTTEGLNASDTPQGATTMATSLSESLSVVDVLRRAAFKAVNLSDFVGTGADVTADVLAATYTPPTAVVSIDENIIYATVLNGPAQAN